jgi:hypothetical protein
MSTTTKKLLQAASEIAGSDKELADLLGITPTLLSLYTMGERDLPAPLFLRVVDFILEDREAGTSGSRPAETGMSRRAHE